MNMQSLANLCILYKVKRHLSVCTEHFSVPSNSCCTSLFKDLCHYTSISKEDKVTAIKYHMQLFESPRNFNFVSKAEQKILHA